MEGRRLILNDGTIIEGGEAGYSQGFLWVWFTGYTLQQAALMFFDTSKTSKIVFQYGEMESVYEGFTTVMNLGIDVDNNVSVCLTKGVTNIA
jgi:hypothetical protein